MLGPARNEVRIKSAVSIITRNNVNVDFPVIIDSLKNYLDSKSAIEGHERFAVEILISNDDEEADALGIEIPDDDSESENSSSSVTPEASISSTNLILEAKASWVRRLKRKLQFYILPRGNLPPVFERTVVKKRLLRRYFKALNIDTTVYVDWFVAL